MYIRLLEICGWSEPAKLMAESCKRLASSVSDIVRVLGKLKAGRQFNAEVSNRIGEEDRRSWILTTGKDCNGVRGRRLGKLANVIMALYKKAIDQSELTKSPNDKTEESGLAKTEVSSSVPGLFWSSTGYIVLYSAHCRDSTAVNNRTTHRLHYVVCREIPTLYLALF